MLPITPIGSKVMTLFLASVLTSLKPSMPQPLILVTQQLVCTDGTGPDPTTGLCADGSHPNHSLNPSMPQPLICYPTTVCSDGTGPDPTTGLCADGYNHSLIIQCKPTGVTTAEQQPVCSDTG